MQKYCRFYTIRYEKQDVSKKGFFNIIQVIFAILMAMIAVATIILDKNVDSLYPNTVIYANGAYYLAAFILLFLSLVIHRCIRGQKDIDIRVYWGIMIAIPIAVWVGWQIPIARWIYWYENAADFGSVRSAAIGLSNGKSFADFSYFRTSPNNANIAIMLSWIYKIIPKWRGIILIGATLTNLSAVLVAISVKNITKSRFTSVISLVLAELLMAMTWRAFLVYTDNFGMIFVALILWVYSLKIEDKYKMPLVIILTAMGTFVKVTIFICLLSIFIHRFFVGVSENYKLVHKLKKVTSILILTVVIFGMMFFAQRSLRSYYGLDLSGRYPKGWQFMFMVGQNSEFYGVNNDADRSIRNSIIEEAKLLNKDTKYVNAKLLTEGIERVGERGFFGNIKFYLKKLNVAYNDGYFHNIQSQPPAASHELSKNLFYKLLWREEAGLLYQVSAGILQVVWDAVLLGLMASVVLLHKKDSYKLYQIMILGITLYVMLFEGRSKYLYMFLPVYLCAGGVAFAECKNQYTRVKNARIHYDKIEGSEGKGKKVGIITFHFVNNFGGALQAYALRKVVENECDSNAVIIDYRNWFIRLTDRIRLLPISSNMEEIASGLKTMGQRISRRNKFGNFTKNNNKLSRKYLNHWQINNTPPGCDKYICGSDQIWNPFLTMGVASNYFLAFEPDADNKIAYAPSFGTDGVASRYQKRIGHYIEAIGHLSVREKSGQELIKKLTGKDAQRLIDPTFLLDKNDWEQIGVNPLKSKEPYILLYIMQRDKEVYEYAKKIKQQMGIRLVEISRYGYRPDFVDETLIDVGPAEFLGLFRDSAYICTNSYHGLAYSIIFEKEFCLIPCKRFKARINNMLDMLQISVALDGDDWDTLTANYDREYVRAVIKAEKEKAIKFLVESVGK